MKIEKGVPMPNVRSKYPWREMEVGDSIFFDNEPKGSQANQVMAARNFAYHNSEYKFTARSEGNGVRIWRIDA